MARERRDDCPHCKEWISSTNNLATEFKKHVKACDFSPARHVDYPHSPGRLYGCPECERRCFCEPQRRGGTPCVFCAGN